MSHPHGLFAWIDLASHDERAARAWYSELFGWEIRQLDTGGGPPYSMALSGGEPVAGIGQLSEEMKAQGIPPVWNSYVAVDDAEAAVARAAELGFTVRVPAMQVMNAGKLAFVVDPFGATIGMWQALEHDGAQRFNRHGALCWNELAVPDARAAAEVYGPLFGWTFAETPNPASVYLTIQLGERPNGGVLQMTESWAGIAPHWTVYFAVDDCDAVAAAVEASGGAVHQPPFDAGGVGRLAMVADPQGARFNVLALAKRP